MWLSLNIVSKMTDIKGISPEELALKLTMSSAEIDSIEEMNNHFKTIIAVKLLSVEKHPDADKLTVVKADTGNGEVQVVCGAPNHKSGDIAALALPGTVFNEEFTVKETKLRGVPSAGMLCSEKELGLSDDHSGIMILPPDTPVGRSFSELYPERMDVRLEIDNKSITHRPDLWSHSGFAREISALLDRPFKEPVNSSIADNLRGPEDIKIKIENPDLSARYTGLAVKNIRVEESPEWLKAAVTSIGMRPINNIVDITNYVMAEIGEPMHAFDRKKLKGDSIIVRTAVEGEKITTIDESELTLKSEDLVIADDSGAIALAGIMGGAYSEIDETTEEIILEAANFNPVTIRKTAQRYAMRTEASIRFEKALSPELTTAAILRCYELIKEIIPEADVSSCLLDAYPSKPETLYIKTDTAFIRQRLGHDIPDEKIIGILKALNFEISEKSGILDIKVPAYRATRDISIPEDIVEEVGRIYGYDNIPPSAPLVASSPPPKNEFRSFERCVKSILSYEYGLAELSGYSFTGEDILNRLGINKDLELRLQNPLSGEQDRLRRSLIPNIIKNIEFNERYFDKFGIYELGRVYLKKDRKSPELAAENTRASGALYTRQPEEPLFYPAKRCVTGLLNRLSIKDFHIIMPEDSAEPYMHPFRTAVVKVEGKPAGYIFEIHPAVKKRFDISGDAALFDIDIDIIFNAQKRERMFTELQRYPEVPFEISLIADRYDSSDKILSIIRNNKSGLVRSADVISIYEGDPVPEGKKSVSIRTVFSSPEKTLSPEEIEKVQNKVIGDLAAAGFPLR